MFTEKEQAAIEAADQLVGTDLSRAYADSPESRHADASESWRREVA